MYQWTDPTPVDGSDVDDLIQQLVVLGNGHPIHTFVKHWTVLVPADEDGAAACGYAVRVSPVVDPHLDLEAGFTTCSEHNNNFLFRKRAWNMKVFSGGDVVTVFVCMSVSCKLRYGEEWQTQPQKTSLKETKNKQHMKKQQNESSCNWQSRFPLSCTCLGLWKGTWKEKEKEKNRSQTNGKDKNNTFLAVGM